MYESTLLYSIAFGAFFGLLVLRQPVYIFARALCPAALQLGLSPFVVVGRYLSIYLVYPTVLNRRKLIERWSCADSLLLLAYILATGVCVVIPLPDIDQIITRTGTLSVINLLFCFASPCLGMLADILHISLHSCRRLHASLGTLAFVLAVIHVVVGGITTRGLNLQTPKNVFALVAILLLCAQIIPLILRNTWFEAALRLHQILAIAFPYALWRHIRSGQLLPGLYVIIGGAMLLTSSAILLGCVIYRNGSGLSLAQMSFVKGTTQIRLHLSRPLKVKAGQYIDLWVPSVSLWSFAQTHPFIVTSWSKEPQKYLDLFIEPRRGFTRNLLKLSEHGSSTSMAWFSGPHGKPTPVSRYENVVMLATESGIAAHLPYLKKLTHDQRSHVIPVRRVHLIWQMGQRDVGIAAQKLLNEALAEDKLNGQYNLRISIYITAESIKEMDFGSRSTAYQGPIPLADVLSSELKQRRRGSKTVISVSMCGAMRDDLINVMRRQQYRGIDVRYAEYQP